MKIVLRQWLATGTEQPVFTPRICDEETAKCIAVALYGADAVTGVQDEGLIFSEVAR